MAIVEDLAPFFADFGEEGTLAGQAVRVIFDAPTESQLMGGALAAVPQVRIATQSVPAGVEGAALDLERGAYTVREHIADGLGVSTLLLRGAA